MDFLEPKAYFLRILSLCFVVAAFFGLILALPQEPHVALVDAQISNPCWVSGSSLLEEGWPRKVDLVVGESFSCTLQDGTTRTLKLADYQILIPRHKIQATVEVIGNGRIDRHTLDVAYAGVPVSINGLRVYAYVWKEANDFGYEADGVSSFPLTSGKDVGFAVSDAAFSMFPDLDSYAFPQDIAPFEAHDTYQTFLEPSGDGSGAETKGAHAGVDIKTPLPDHVVAITDGWVWTNGPWDASLPPEQQQGALYLSPTGPGQFSEPRLWLWSHFNVASATFNNGDFVTKGTILGNKCGVCGGFHMGSKNQFDFGSWMFLSEIWNNEHRDDFPAPRYWLVLGPYSGDMSSVHVAANESGDISSSILPKEGAFDKDRNQQWKFRDNIFQGITHMGELVSDSPWSGNLDQNPKNSVAYAATYIYSPVDHTTDNAVHLKFGSNYGASVWLNGQSIYDNTSTLATHRYHTYDRTNEPPLIIDEVDRVLPLKQGWNTFIVKTNEATNSAWRFSAKIGDSNGVRMPELVFSTRTIDLQATSITDNSVRINWSAPDFHGTFAETYKLAVATDADFTNLLIADQDLGRVTSHTITGLSSATTYYIRVKPYSYSEMGGSVYWHHADTINTATSGQPPSGPLLGQVMVDPRNPAWLVYNKDDNGDGTLDPFFMAGPGDPEDFLYRGTRNADGTRNGDQMELINKLKGTGANSIYLMGIRSHGGDGDSTHNPFIGNDPAKGINTAVLDQWETWFTAMDNNGIVTYFFFYDDAINVSSNLGWPLDTSGNLHPQEQNYIETVVNRFEHHKNLIWVVMEEVQEMGPDYVAHTKKIAESIRTADDYDHPIAVHKLPGFDFSEFATDPNIDQFAIQDISNPSQFHADMLTAWNNAAGRYNLNLAEPLVYEASPKTGSALRKELWSVAMTGTHIMVIGMDIANTLLGDLQDLGRMRAFMESTSFNEMASHDELAFGGTEYVLANPGDSYIAYASSLTGDIGLKGMTSGTYDFAWYDILTGTTIQQTGINVTSGDQTWTKPASIGSELAVYMKRTGVLAGEFQIPKQGDWADRGTVLTPGPSGSWDVRLTGMFSPCTVIKRGGTYYLYYIGADGNRADDGGPRHRALGVATSADGITFIKHPSNPIIEHLPNINAPASFHEEEGVWSCGATFDTNGDVVLYYGAMTAFAPSAVNDDALMLTSPDGINFADGLTGTVVIDHANPLVYGGGDELDPLGALHVNGNWYVYYSIATGGTLKWTAGIASGPAKDNLTTTGPIPALSSNNSLASGMDPQFLSADTFALFYEAGPPNINAPTEVRTASVTAPEQLSPVVESYNFGAGFKHPTVFLDKDTNTWFMYYLDDSTTAGTIKVKTAPALGDVPPPPPPPPTLAITSPTQSQTIQGNSVTVNYTSSGDFASYNVDHAHLQLDSNPEIRGVPTSGSYTFLDVPEGLHTVTGYLAQADHTEVPNTRDTVSFTTTIPVSAKFSIGDRVEATQNLNVRATPSTSGTLLGTQLLGVQGTVIAGPIFADSYWWWHIDYDQAPDGWSVEDFLEKKIVLPPTPGNTFIEPFIWKGNHAATINGDTTVWWDEDNWDVRSDTGYNSAEAYGGSDYASIHRSVPELNDGIQTSGSVVGGDGSSGVGILHVEGADAIMSARLRNPMLISATQPGVVEFWAPNFVTTGHWWEIAITPAGTNDVIGGGEWTGLPSVGDPLGALQGPGHRPAIDSINFITIGTSDVPCQTGWTTQVEVTKSIGDISTDYSGFTIPTDPSELTELYNWRLEYWPDRIEAFMDLNEDGVKEHQGTMYVSIPWSEVYVNIIGAAYQIYHHPQVGCGWQGLAIDIPFKEVKVSPVQYARTAAYPKNDGTDQIPKNTGWTDYDTRDMKNFGPSTDNPPQPNEGQYDKWGSFAFDSSKTLSFNLPAGDATGIARAQFVYDVNRFDSGTLAINGVPVGTLPDTGIWKGDQAGQGRHWVQRSIDVDPSVFVAGQNTVTININGDVAFDRLHFEFAYTEPPPAPGVNSLKSGDWSDPAVWSTGVVPRAGENIVINPDHAVMYDVLSDEVLGSITINGTLKFSRTTSTRLKVHDNIIVENGFLDMGVASDYIPRNVQAEIVFVLPEDKVFVGADEEGKPHFLASDTGLWAKKTGRWESHGAPLKYTWSKLAADANVGSISVIAEKDVSDWYVGGTVVISSSAVPRQYQATTSTGIWEEELRTITALTKLPDGTTHITVDKPLVYEHAGSGTMRAEVGLLTRNVRIFTEREGYTIPDDALFPDTSQRRFAHTMFMAQGSLQYTEFKYMGHVDARARYPIHFHQTGNLAQGSIVRGNAVWMAGFRGLVVHDTNGVLVEDNVLYDTWNFGYFLEKTPNTFAPGEGGSENVYVHNLAVRTRPAPAWAPGLGASSFWLEHSDQMLFGNVMTGNAIIDSSDTSGDGSGAFAIAPAADQSGQTRPLVFIKNEAHSNFNNGFYARNANMPSIDVLDFLSWRNGYAGVFEELGSVPYRYSNAQLLENSQTNISTQTLNPFVQQTADLALVINNTTVTMTVTPLNTKTFSKVEFWMDENELGETTTAPLTFGVDLTTRSRNYTYVYAKTYDQAGQVGYSQVVEIGPEIGTTPVAPPRLHIVSPTANQVISGDTVAITYITSGDLSTLGVNHAHFQLDSDSVVMDIDFDGFVSFANVPAGSHTIQGWLVDRNHAKIAGSDTSVSFETQSVLSAKFSIGDRVEATQNLNVRATPSTSGTLLGTQLLGVQGTVIAGPIFADSYWWWHIDYDQAPDGWSAEDWLEKVVEPRTVEWLHVEGNKIVNETGDPVILRGVNLEEREWQWGSNPNIDYEKRAIPVISGDPSTGWGANVILIAIASGPINRGDSLYLSFLDEMVQLAKANKAYTLMVYRYAEPNTTQPGGPPDQAAEDAMAALALRYKDEPAVLYGLQVEPHDVSWSELKPRFITMIDAIKANNSQALIAVPGTQYSRYIHWAISDPIPRSNLIYKTHPYDPWSAIQSGYQLDQLSDIYPVLLGEFGPGSFMDMSDVTNLLDFAETKGLSWTAWLFNDTGCPCLLAEKTGFTPTDPYGVEIKKRLQTGGGGITPPPQVPLPFRINAGGSQYADTEGSLWLADQSYSSSTGWGYVAVGGGQADTGLDVAGTPDDAIFATERWGMQEYRIDVPNGIYDVNLLFAETWTGVTAPNQRVFNVSIESVPVLAAFDAFAEAGFATAITKSLQDIIVLDNQLNIVFTALVENPAIKGIEIERASAGPIFDPTLIFNHIFLDDLEPFVVTGLDFVPTEDFRFRLEDPDTQEIRLEVRVKPKDESTIEIDFRLEDTSALVPGFYVIELERELTLETITHVEELLITKLGDLWSLDAQETDEQVRDGKIDIHDVSRLLSHWNSTNPQDLLEADFNGPVGSPDGLIDLYDANKMMANWTP